MAQTEITITIDDDYVVPEGHLSLEEYVIFVANRAAESYMKQYNTTDFLSGVHAACDAYNATITSLTSDTEEQT
jgi:hypothetical protein